MTYTWDVGIQCFKAVVCVRCDREDYEGRSADVCVGDGEA